MPLPIPPVYLLAYRLDFNETLRLGRELGDALQGDIEDADIVIGNVMNWRNAQLQLRQLLVGKEYDRVERIFPRLDTDSKTDTHHRETQSKDAALRPSKRRKVLEEKSDTSTVGRKEVIVIDSSTESEAEDNRVHKTSHSDSLKRTLAPEPAITHHEDDPVQNVSNDAYKIVKLSWYYDSVKEGKVLPLAPYLIYEGRKIRHNKAVSTVEPHATKLPSTRPMDILARSKADTPPREQFSQHRYRGRRSQTPNSLPMSHPPPLLPQTTSDHEEAENLPPLPSYLAEQFPFRSFSCHRPTPRITPNDEFLAQLRTIREHRELTVDPTERGPPGLSYARSIASIASYPFTITTSQEMARLPHCGPSVLQLYQEWKDTGKCSAVEEIEANERFKILKLFFGVYDVGAKTAREWYAKGWRDLDDCVLNWDTLTQNQQLGVKYYDDFNDNKIPRVEVEAIAAVILEYANKLQDGYQMVVVGGYRRGKPMSGDVDVILTHPDEAATHRFIGCITAELMKDGWITHVLSNTERNSNRGQEPLARKGGEGGGHGAGFDSLDKSLVIWHNAELAKDPQNERPNPRRRVDIIISPWKTAGCAIIGWSGQTMFERDLRSYCRKSLGFKFDSSGIREVEPPGIWQDFEGDASDLLEKEKLVFKGLGVEWTEPNERCTG